MSFNMMAFYLVLLASHNPPRLFNTRPGRERVAGKLRVGMPGLFTLHLLHIWYWTVLNVNDFTTAESNKIRLIHSGNVLRLYLHSLVMTWGRMKDYIMNFPYSLLFRPLCSWRLLWLQPAVTVALLLSSSLVPRESNAINQSPMSCLVHFRRSPTTLLLYLLSLVWVSQEQKINGITGTLSLFAFQTEMACPHGPPGGLDLVSGWLLTSVSLLICSNNADLFGLLWPIILQNENPKWRNFYYLPPSH